MRIARFWLLLIGLLAACGGGGTFIDAGEVDADKGVDAQTSFTVTITMSGNSNGTVTSFPAGIDCGTGCTVLLPMGSPLTLTATPDANTAFTGWTGGECTGTAACELIVTEDVTIDAAFDLQRFTVDVIANGNGTGSITSVPTGIDCGLDCSEELDHGTQVTLTATPDSGTTFLGWTGGGCEASTGDCVFDVESDVTIQAAFALNNSVVVTLAGNGTGDVTSVPTGIDCGADCSEAYAPGTLVTLTAVATGDSFFEGWSGGACAGVADCVLTVDQAVGVTATFTLHQYTLDVAVDGTGSGDVTSAPIGIDCGLDCTHDYDSGTGVVLTPTPSEGRFAGWTGGDCVGLGPCTVDMSVDQSVIATFDLITVESVTSPTANGVYTVPAVITVQVTFSDPVVVTGTPILTLSSGGVATYASGSGTTTLTFTYTVGAGQNSADLDYLSTGALTLDGGTIRDAIGNDATLELPTPGQPGSLAANEAIIIDTAAPTVSMVTASNPNGSYTIGAVINVQVVFSESVVVTGTPVLTLDSGAPAVAYAGGSGTSTLTFAYTVAVGQTSADLDYAATTSLALNAGTIVDVATNAAALALPAPGAAGSLGANKAIVIDTTGPVVTSVTSSTANGTYGVGGAINVQVVFSENVAVTGVPQLALNSGATVNYTSGSGTSTLVFAYTVAAAQSSADLDYVATNSLTLNAGTLADATGNNATRTLPPPGGAGSLGANKNLVIDTAGPTVTSVTSSTANGTYGVGTAISIQIAFSESVTVAGVPQLVLNSGATVSYSSGSGTSTLTFTYVVGAGQNATDLDYASSTSLGLNGGTIQDGTANPATLTLPAPGAAGSLGANKNLVVDTTGPVVTNVTSPTGNATYGVGAPIAIQVVFSENVVVTGAPQLTLNTAGTAGYTTGSGTSTLTFTYTVGAGQNTTDLDYAASTSLALNGGTILDASSNAATLALAAPAAAGSLGANKAIVIDTAGPTVSGVTSSTAAGTYGVGAAISIQVAFTEVVAVTGAPLLALNTGATASYTSGSATNTLTFTYTVGAGQSAADLDYAAISSLSLNSGTIRDGASNNATLTLPTPGAAGSLAASEAIVIDTAGPVVTGLTSSTAAGTYGAGQVISIQVAFNEAAVVTGIPQLALTGGGTASYASGSGTGTLTFSYTVAAGHSTADLDESSTGALTLNAGTVRDATGNNATLALPAPQAAGSLGANAAIVIDAVSPTVGSVNSTTANGTYGVGAAVSIQVNLTEAVTVTGTPQLTLNNGAIVNYASGSGTTQLTFSYTVATGQSTGDLDEASTTALALNAGTIRDTSANNAALTLPAPQAAGSLGANKAIVIDATVPTVSGISSTTAAGTYGVGAAISIQIAFSEAVTVTGAPQLALDTGGVAGYASGSGTSTLTFTYTVAAGHTTSDLDEASATALTLNAGTIRDAGSNNAILTLPAPAAAGSLGANEAIVIDTTVATVSNVTSSTPAGSYGAGAVISIQVAFSEAVTVTGTPLLALNSGATASASYASGSGSSTLTFTYTVGAGNSSSDLDYDATNSLTLNSGTIRDGASSNATLTLPTPGAAGSLAASEAIVIDTAGPVVTGLTSSTAAGTYSAGQVISIQVAFNEAAVVTGIPQLALTGGGTASYASGSGTGTLTFSYTVLAGHSTLDLDESATTALTLNAGTIRDATGNNATLAVPAPQAAGSLGANAAIVIDAVSPTVGSVNSTTANGTYGVGAAVSIQVNLTEAVTVTGTPQLTLNNGAIVNYASGSGTTQLTFSYTVATGQSTGDLDEASTTALALNAGTIRDASANNAALTLPAPQAAGSLGANKAIVIDATVPTVSGLSSTTAAGTYGVGAAISIQIAFSEAVTVTGAPQLALDTGGAAGYASGSGTSTLTFTYTVAAGHTTSDLDEASATALTLNAGTIRDAGSNNATLTLPAPGAANSLGASEAIVVDTTVATVSGVSSSTPAGSYGAGAVISIQVAFSEAVTVTGTPQLALNSGATASASYAGGSGSSTLTFTYTVGAGDSSSDLDYDAASSLTLNSGTIRDAAASNATLTLPAPGAAGSLGANEAIAIDTGAPAVSSLTSSTANGTYGPGDLISIQIAFNESVVVTGTPQLALTGGGTASYASGSGTGTLTFSYTVAAGHSTADLDESSTGALTLNAGTIRDATGNNASLTLPAPQAAGSLGANKAIVIDGVVPAVSNLDSTTANGTYGVGAAISIQVNFTEAVTVTGTPLLTLNNGAVVSYASGSGTSQLTFSYTVATGQSTTDLDEASPSALALNAGTIRDAADNNATLILPAPQAAGSLGANKAIVIDATVAAVTTLGSTTNNGTYGVGAAISIQINFSEAVTVTGAPQLALDSGGSAAYASGSGTSQLTFSYTVGAGQATGDLDEASTSALTLNAGTIRDAGSNNATLTLPAPQAAGSLGASKAIVIDTAAATVSGVSSTTSAGSYGIGAVISIQVAFTEAVTVTGTPLLALNSGATTTASYTSGSTTSILTFTYTVGAGESTPDLDYDTTSSLTLNSGTIRDGAANNAALALPAPGAAGSLGANEAIAIDTAAPTVSSLNSSTANGTYGAGQLISIQVNFNENVVVTGTPQLALTGGGTASYASGSGSTQLSFNYTVLAGHSTLDLDESSTGALTLNAGTIRDATGNNATLTLPAPQAGGSLGANKAIVIDAVVPQVSSLNATTANGTYGIGGVISIQINFTEAVNVTGMPLLTLNTGAVVSYASGSGTSQLSFTYTVAAGQSTTDLDEGSTGALALNAGTIRDAAGNNATVTLPAPQAAGSLGANKAIAIDGIVPAVSTLNSSTANGSYPTGATISIQINFTEAVVVTGSPRLTLNTGALASYTGGSGSSQLTFGYTVGAGESTGDLDEASTSALALNAGTIRDAGSNPATLTLPAPQAAGSLGANKAIVIDTAAPIVASLSSPNANATYRSGSVSITVAFNEVVYVTGVPRLALSSGGIATYASGSGTGVLTFTYALVNGQNSPDLDQASTTALTLNSGTIRDLAGNNASLTLPSPQGAGSLAFNKNLVIDTGPIVIDVTSSTNDSTYGAGAYVYITVTFNESITANGQPFLNLNSGGIANSSDTSGGTLYLQYIVGAGQASADLDYINVNALVANGTITDDFGTSATLTLASPGATSSLGFNKNIVIINGITRWTAGSNEWPDNACNPTTSFGLCNTDAQLEANAWATYECQHHGYATGVWTGQKYGGCNGPESMYCGNSGAPCIPAYERSCGSGDQTVVEFTCSNPTHATWDPSWSLPGVNYGNGNLSIASASTSTTSVRTNLGRSSGKYYWEIRATGGSASINAGGLGIVGPDWPNNAPYVGAPASSFGFGYGPSNYQWWYTWQGADPSGTPWPESAINAGNVYMFALDLDNDRFWVGMNGGWFNQGTPENGNGAVVYGIGGTVYPAVTFYGGSTNSFYANFGDTNFIYAVPFGFNAGFF